MKNKWVNRIVINYNIYVNLYYMDIEKKIKKTAAKVESIMRVIVLVFAVIFLVWLLTNYKELDALVFLGYVPCFYKTFFRRKNFMRIKDKECEYINSEVARFLRS
jgi:hypothetical protein